MFILHEQIANESFTSQENCKTHDTFMSHDNFY